MPDPLLSRVADPLDFERHVREHSVTLACPLCKNSWEFYDGTGSGLEKLVARKLPDNRCPECYQKDPVPADLPRDVFLRKAGVPELFRERRFIEPPRWPRDRGKGRPAAFGEIDPALWQGKAPWCIGFRGPTSTGKTSFAVELLWRNRSRFQEPWFIRADSLVSRLFGAKGPEEREDAYRAATDRRLVILDDLGWGVNGRGAEAMNEIISERHARRLATLWTVNQGMEEMTKRLPPMLRRLEEGLILTLSEKDAWGVNGEPPQGFRQLSMGER